MPKKLLVVVVCVVSALPVWAQDSILTDRPDFTEGAVAVGKGRFQAETGVTGARGRGGVREFSTEALLRYGIAAKTELRLGLPAYTQIRGGGSSDSGFGDIYAGAKFQLGPTKSGLDISVIPAVFLPSGEREFSSDAVDPEVKFCVGKDLTERIGLSGMLYVSYPTEEDGRNATLQPTVSLSYAFTEKIGSFYELAGTFPRRGGPESLFHTGLTFQPTVNTQWDVHFGVGLNRNAPLSFLAGGYSVRF